MIAQGIQERARDSIEMATQVLIDFAIVVGVSLLVASLILYLRDRD